MTDDSQIVERHLVIDEHNQGNAVDCLNKVCALSKQQIKSAMAKGALWQDSGKGVQRLRRAKKVLTPGSQLHLYYDPRILSTPITSPTAIADATGYSIWFKPYGVYSQGSKWGDHCTINRWVAQQLDRPAFIVHRLDRATTGLMIIAHSKSAAAAFSAIFRHRKITKHYRAIVQGHVGDSVTLDSDIDSRSAISHLRPLAFDSVKNRSALEVHIETGRKHQIRKHLLAAGHPVVGDRLYGAGADWEQNLQLCCSYLSFICPVDGSTKHYRLNAELLPKL
jgi:tRNA pseudouridine32 synthase/23S rRNA pseudouridine746 synthase